MGRLFARFADGLGIGLKTIANRCTLFDRGWGTLRCRLADGLWCGCSRGSKSSRLGARLKGKLGRGVFSGFGLAGTRSAGFRRRSICTGGGRGRGGFGRASGGFTRLFSRWLSFVRRSGI